MCSKMLSYKFFETEVPPSPNTKFKLFEHMHRVPTGPGKSLNLKAVLESPRKSCNLLIFMKNYGKALKFYAIFVREIFFSK